MSKKFIVLLILAVTSLAGCSDPNGREVTNNDNIDRYRDDQYAVTCWVYSATNQGGISCLHDRDLVSK